MLEKIGSFLYHKVFINIYLKNNALVVYVEKRSRKGIVFSEEKIFNTITLDDDMIKYINFFIKDTPYFYVSILDSSTTQGAAPTCEQIDISKFYDRSLSKYRCFDDKWSYYTSRYDLDEIENNFSDLGLDFVFSPFIVLANFFKDKIETTLSIFLLVQDYSISLSIFDNSQLLFAQQLNIKNEFDSDDFEINEDEDEDVSIEEPQEESVDLDSIDLDDNLDDLDVFGDIEDLDSIEEIDEFADIEEELEEEDLAEKTTSNNHSNSAEHEELFDEDYQMFTAIQASIKIFYDDARYNSEFLETIYIADSIGISGDLKTYLEEEMFLSVYVRQINLSSEIAELVQVELDEI